MVTEKARPDHKEPTWLARLIPLLRWAPQYERSWLRPDLIAGLTVTALVVPKALGYAGIARVPIEYGLYAAAGAILYALFGTSRQISTGPSSALAAQGHGSRRGVGCSPGVKLRLPWSIAVRIQDRWRRVSW